MKNLVLVVLFFSSALAVAQNQVGINQPNVDNSAVLEMNSEDKGFLMPRMTATNKSAINNPAQGLLIYETSSVSYWYFNGATWIKITSDNAQNDGIGNAASTTRIVLDATNDNDQIRFFSRGTQYFRMNRKRWDNLNNGNSVLIGENAGLNDDLRLNYNVLIGTSAGLNSINARRNVGVGMEVLRDNADDDDNIAIGNFAMNTAVTARRNIAIGVNVLRSIQTSDLNVVIGHNAMTNHTDRNNNVVLGINALNADESCQNIVAIGTQSLNSVISRSSLVSVGHQAGFANTGGNSIYLGYKSGSTNTNGSRMYIDNEESLTPLLFANFTSDALTINGSILINGNVKHVGTLTDVSDYRLKSNILEVNGTLDRLNNLQGYRYHRIGSEVNEFEFGLVAQEVKKIFPNLVRKVDDRNNYIGVSYVQFIPLILEAEKEQFEILEQLRSSQRQIDDELDSIENELKLITSRLEKDSAAL